jgi:hypothetical protein
MQKRRRGMPRLYVECISKGRWIEHRQEYLHPAKPKAGWSGTPDACATKSDSKELGVNKRDSPRISTDIHIDRRQPLGVILKGSSLVSVGTEEAASGFGLAGFGSDLGSQIKQVSRSSRVSFRGKPRGT